MAAKESSSSLASPQTSFPIFVDTSLDTHLAMLVSPDDTVGDLKRKIGNEHALCFPNVGEITVQSMKVRRRASFYHLSDAMLVKSAFAGVKGTWFLHIDAVSISLLKNKLGAGKDITGESGGLTEKCHVTQAELNAHMLIDGCADRDKGIVMNMLLAENDLVLPESQALPDAFSEKLSVQGDSLLPNNESQNLCLQVSSSDPLARSDTNVSAANLSCLTGHVLQDNFGKSISELGKRSDYDVEQMKESVTEDITMVSAQLQHDTVQVADEGEKDGRDEDTGNVGARSDDEAVTIKIAKSRKRSNALENGELLESKSHNSLEKKKQKKQLDVSIKEPVEDHVRGSDYESYVHSKETSKLENPQEANSLDKHDNPASTEGLQSTELYADSLLPQKPTDDKQKKKRKKGSAKLHDEIDTSTLSTCALKSNHNDENPYAESGLTGNSLNKADAALLREVAKGNDNEALVNNHEDQVKATGEATFVEEVFQDMSVEKSIEEFMTGPPFTEAHADSLLPQKPTGPSFTEVHANSLPAQKPTDDKQKKKRKKGSAKLQDEIDTAILGTSDLKSNDNAENPCAKSGLAGNSLNKTDAGLLREVTKGNDNEALVDNHEDQVKVTGAAVKVTGAAEFVKEVFQKVPVEKSVEEGMTGPPSTKFNESERRTKRLSKSRKSCKDIPIQEQATLVNSEGPLEGDHTGISKESNAAVIQKDVESRKPAEVDSEVRTNSHRGKKKSKKESLENLSSKPCALHSLENQGSEEDYNEACGKKSMMYDSKGIAEEDMSHPNHKELDPEVPSNTNAQVSQHSQRKKSDKAEFSDRQFDTHESVHSSSDQFTGENPNKSGRRHRNTVKVSEKASDNVLGEAAALVNSLVVDATVSFNLNDKKSRRSKKKSGKTESDSELVRTESAYLVKEAENPIEPLEDNHKDHHKQSMSRTAFREAASLDGPVELDSVVVSNNSGKSSRHRKKKTAKTEMLCQSSCNQNADQSIGNHHTDENLEEALRTSNNGSVNECKSIVIPGDTAQDMAQVKHSDTVSTVLFSNSDKEEISQLSSEKGTEENAALLGKTGEGSDKEVSQGFKNRGSAQFNERNDCMEVPKPQSDKINFVDYFVAKESQLEPVAKTENRKANKEKTKRKRKLELPSDEQPMFTEKKQVGDSNNHDFVQSLVQPPSKELTRKTHSKKTRRTTKSSVNLQVTSSDIVSPVKSHDADLPEKEPQDYESDIYDRVLTLMDKNGKDMNMNSTSYDSKLHSLPGNADSHNMPSADAVPQYIDGSVRSRHGNAPSVQNHSIVSADIPATEAMDDMPASDGSTEEETPLDNKRYRVAVRKRPTKMLGKVSEKSNQGKITTSTIFGDTTSGSSEEEFEIGSRQSAKRTFSDNSTTSADSDRDSDKTRTTNLLNSPGVESNPHGKNDRRADGKGNRLMQSPNDKIKNMPLSMVLKSSNSYRKARLTASQSEFEDGESQPVDVVFESQPELASP